MASATEFCDIIISAIILEGDALFVFGGYNMAKVPVEKGKLYNIKINSLGSSGEGVGRIDGFTVFVVGGLPGEELSVKISEVKKSYATGQLVKIVKPSPERVEPPCGIYKECGGCQLQHLSYECQLKAKHQQVKDAMERIGHLKNLPILPTIGAQDPWNYRNKVAFPVGREKGRTIIGCFAPLMTWATHVLQWGVQRAAKERSGANPRKRLPVRIAG